MLYATAHSKQRSPPCSHRYCRPSATTHCPPPPRLWPAGPSPDPAPTHDLCSSNSTMPASRGRSRMTPPVPWYCPVSPHVPLPVANGPVTISQDSERLSRPASLAVPHPTVATSSSTNPLTVTASLAGWLVCCSRTAPRRSVSIRDKRYCGVAVPAWYCSPMARMPTVRRTTCFNSLAET